ncbi:spherulation-specific family 4 protein [Solihabitans fulvus]|uniref:spherulation-specific family 4 protein n=1 Tax=Solihabitans fulvus TaxID=1892852 RepID=UPI0016618E8B|nr:spherulation-specific family 4 protein [Solihabitans fulvus]
MPAYFHPAVAPGDWAAVAAAAALVRLVVLNIADGAGERPDCVFLPALDRLRASDIPVAGYVDTDYGRRAAELVLREVIRYRQWYGVDEVFFDRVSTDRAHLPHYAALARSARGLGARGVAFHHGAYPAREYVEHADLVGVFEGDLADHRAVVPPRWALRCASDRFYHLVHGVPDDCVQDTIDRVTRLGAAHFAVTERGGANPWDRLPGWFPHHTRRSRECAPGH